MKLVRFSILEIQFQKLVRFLFFDTQFRYSECNCFSCYYCFFGIQNVPYVTEYQVFNIILILAYRFSIFGLRMFFILYIVKNLLWHLEPCGISGFKYENSLSCKVLSIIAWKTITVRLLKWNFDNRKSN